MDPQVMGPMIIILFGLAGFVVWFVAQRFVGTR